MQNYTKNKNPNNTKCYIIQQTITQNTKYQKYYKIQNITMYQKILQNNTQYKIIQNSTYYKIIQSYKILQNTTTILEEYHKDTT